MDSFEQWWAKEHPVYDSGNNTVQEHTAAQKGLIYSVVMRRA